MTINPRPRRSAEVYAVTCPICHGAVEVPADQPVHCCPRCGARLLIQWTEARAA